MKTPIKSERHNRDPLVNRNLSGRYNENSTTTLFKTCFVRNFSGRYFQNAPFIPTFRI